MLWTTEQIKRFARAVRRQWGPGWDFLGKHLQECAVSLTLIRAIMMQHDSSFNNVKDLIRSVMQETGVWEKE